MTSLTVSNVSKNLGGSLVLNDISLRVASGTRIAIVGASGSGKSTLLRLIAGFDRVNDGEIALDEKVVVGRDSFVPAHRRGVGYVAQHGALFPHLTVEKNIRFGLSRRISDPLKRVHEVAELVALDSALLTRFPHELSGGQQQRVVLARTLAPAPGVVLLDEPFTALDTGLRAQTRQTVINALEESAVTTVLVTHDQDEAMSFGRQIGIIENGELVQSGAPCAVFDNPVTAATAEFLGGAVFLPATTRAEYAECALGRIPIRHDRSAGVRHVRILLRPDQMTLRPEIKAPNATVVHSRSRGSYVEVTVRLRAEPDSATVTLRVPTFEQSKYQPGTLTTVNVSGGGVLYANTQ